MNAARLIFGWIFLAGLTAAGTFYGMDEVDSRIGLASLKLHDKFGITRYAAAIPKVVTPSTIPAGGPASSDPHAPLPSSPGTPLVPPSSVPSSVPDKTPAVVPSPVTPAPVTPGPAPVAPAYRTPSSPAYPPRSVPSVSPGPGPGAAPSRVPAAPPSRPADWGDVNNRLIDVKGQADGALSHWNGIAQSLRSQNLSLRPPIAAALSSLRNYVGQAEQALRAGDTVTARRDLDGAEKQLQILQGFDQ